MQPQVYLAGPMMGLTVEESNGWRVYVEKKLALVEINLVNPVGYEVPVAERASNFILGDVKQASVAWDIDGIRRSDLILVGFPTDEFGFGTPAEMGIAFERGIPIIVWKHSSTIQHGFIDYMADEVHLSLDAAITSVRRALATGE